MANKIRVNAIARDNPTGALFGDLNIWATCLTATG